MTPLYPKPIRTGEQPSLEALIERYRTSEAEASGILHAIVDVIGEMPYTNFNLHAIDFLILVGHEGRDPWEPLGRLREDARKILVRRVASDLLPRSHVRKEEIVIVHRLLHFFGDSDRHYPSPGYKRDRETLCRFLERCWSLWRNTTSPTDRWEHLVEASINLEYLDPLEPNAGDVLQLYRFLYRKLSKEVRGQLPDRPRLVKVGSGATQYTVDSTVLLCEAFARAKRGDGWNEYLKTLLYLRALQTGREYRLKSKKK